MSMTAVRNMLLAAATAINAVGLLTVAAPAQANTCDNYQFPAAFRMAQDNNITVKVSNPATPTFEDVAATYYLNSFEFSGGKQVGNMAPTDGHAFGGVTGTAIDFTINWDSGPGTGLSNHYTGVVNANGTAQGTSQNSRGTQNAWASAPMTLLCLS
jgi:hypothetical protein